MLYYKDTKLRKREKGVTKTNVNVVRCATHTCGMGWRAYKAFQPAARPVARHCCYLFGGLYGRVGWA